MQKSGELHLFVSYAPGVGKSYQMLRMADKQQKEGKKVVYADVFDGHRDSAYQETSTGYRMSSIISLNPDIVVMDEFTMTERNLEDITRAVYEDVELLLEQGISVFSTVNMMAFEEINRICGNRTGFHRKQVLSEKWLKRAMQVYFIDWETDKLYQQYQEGRLFSKTGINAVTDLIFKKENLDIYRKETINYLQKFSNVIWIKRETEVL